MSRLNDYNGLPGVAGPLQGPSVSSVSGFMVALRKHRTCSAAGDHGAVQAWKDDAGEWRVALMRFGQIVEQQVWRQKQHLRDWLAAMLPAIHNPDHH